MKKLLALALTLASLVFAAPSAEAKTGAAVSSATILANSAAPQFGRRNGRGMRNSVRGRIFIQTRFVRYGRRVYRETYMVRYLPFGGVQTRLISRVRVR